ncbi:LOW QUALITY PROTEIN: thiamine transporter 1-like [Rhopalosiphum maidis]|uniref:LOW QUALITY PROTEIN: thiamine transporter 1-like n=1 Tax=Rhopalosiphum maidis TaxID=43146 RepID=UPI000EFDF676|nr:LOW QUALITY PROTEIN: thiamine transporter 1-like [Rhopalosiphum maidis]
MEKWLIQSIWIAVFGFLKEFRPEDPYIIQYLTNPPMNFTNQEVNQEIFPVSTYTCLCLTIVMFLVTDYLRYKPIVVLNALSSFTVQILLIFTRTKTDMKIMEVFYGTMTACEVAYYTYVYSKVDKKYYKTVSSHMKMACLIGRLVSALLAQTLIDNHILTVSHLNYLTLAGATASIFWAFGLPSIKSSLYFHQSSEHTYIRDNADVNVSKPKTVCQRLWSDFITAFTNRYVLQWSIWWALGTCFYYQCMAYFQSLWQEIYRNGTDLQVTDNGLVEAIYTIISTLGVYLVGIITIPSWWLVGTLTFSQGLLLFIMAQEKLLSHAYIGYIMFGTFYHIMATAANCEVAKNIPADSYALVFGVNTFMSLLLQTCLTVVVNSPVGLMLDIRTQFYVYSGGCLIIGALFTVGALCSTYNTMMRHRIFTTSN